MINFILGIFTGITIAILWGHYLNNQRKKEKKTNPPKAGEIGVYIDGRYIGGLKSTSLPEEEQVVTSLQTQLQDAIDREDFKEAARLRDLINKK